MVSPRATLLAFSLGAGVVTWAALSGRRARAPSDDPPRVPAAWTVRAHAGPPLAACAAVTAPGGPAPRWPVLVTPAGDVLYGTADERFHVLRLGAPPLLELSARSDFVATPAVDAEGAVALATLHGEVGLLAPDLNVAWVRALGAPVRGALAFDARGDVLVATMGPRPRVYALDRATGAVRARHLGPLTDGADTGFAAGVRFDPPGEVFVPTHEGTLVLDQDLVKLRVEPTRGRPTLPPASARARAEVEACIRRSRSAREPE